MRFLTPYIFATSILLFSSCTRVFLGSAELGSKTEPVRLLLEKTILSKKVASTDELHVWEECLEKQSGYRIRFSFSLNRESILFDLAQGEAQMGLVWWDTRKPETLPNGIRYLLSLNPTSAASLEVGGKNRALVASPFLNPKPAAALASHFVMCGLVSHWL